MKYPKALVDACALAGIHLQSDEDTAPPQQQSNAPAPAPQLSAPVVDPLLSAQLVELQQKVGSLTSQLQATEQEKAQAAQQLAAQKREEEQQTLTAAVTALPPATHEHGQALATAILDGNATTQHLEAFLKAFPASAFTTDFKAPGAPSTSAVPSPESRSETGEVDQALVDKERKRRNSNSAAATNSNASGAYVPSS